MEPSNVIEISDDVIYIDSSVDDSNVDDICKERSIISVSSSDGDAGENVSIITISSDGNVVGNSSIITVSDDDVSSNFESAHIEWGNISHVASFDGDSFNFDSSSMMILPQPRTSTRLVERITADVSIEWENGA